ncbi:GNAT family N-acetyltransferase [Shewanella maritima]|uniref:GNAT family N-acetyltransferase n=1 Tax=Shewanella maritima TaxID=2520507 RepID=UPI0037352A10
MKWKFLSFNELSLDELYNIMQLRVNVFVVEQNCPYPELDNKDRHAEAVHVFAVNDQQDMVAYARVLPPGLSYPQASIGRVIVASKYRGHNLGAPLMHHAINTALAKWPKAGIQIGAQQAIERFYVELGFKTISPMYLEDDIPHIDMVYQAE